MARDKKPGNTYFASALVKLIEEKYGGHQQNFANLVGLDSSVISYYVSGRRSPERGNLEKLLSKLPRMQAADLFVAYLLDCSTVTGADLVDFVPRRTSPPAKDVREKHGVLPPDVESILEGLRNRSPADVDLQNFLRCWAKTAGVA